MSDYRERCSCGEDAGVSGTAGKGLGYIMQCSRCQRRWQSRGHARERMDWYRALHEETKNPYFKRMADSQEEKEK